jgi:hypothetical protein
LADPSVRKAIHVGNLTYNDGTAVEKHLLNDVMDSVKPWITTLMDNYKVDKLHKRHTKGVAFHVIFFLIITSGVFSLWLLITSPS